MGLTGAEWQEVSDSIRRMLDDGRVVVSQRS
jgi:hypothetical protein